MVSRTIMKAAQVLRLKLGRNGVTVEMVLWRLPSATPDRPHGIKYRFYCECENESLVRYDNEAGKGDHRHYGELEEPYAFTSVEQLVADFRNDCARLAGWEWDL